MDFVADVYQLTQDFMNDYPEPIEHPINISYAPDIAQSFRAIYHFSFYIPQCKQYRTPSQAIAALPAVDPQLFCRLPIPSGLDFIRKWQAGYRLESVSLKRSYTLPEMLFIMTAQQCFDCFLPLSHTPKPLGSNTDLVSITVFTKIHALEAAIIPYAFHHL